MTTTYATRFSHTARRWSGVIASSLDTDEVCIGGGGRTSENGRREGTALEGDSDEGLDTTNVVETEGVVAAVPLIMMPDLTSCSGGRS